MSNVFLAGGAGFIGSHTAVELLNAGHNIVIADDFSNSSLVIPEKVKEISGKDFPVYRIDIKDTEKLSRIFDENSIDIVIHFAGLKSVAESAHNPLKYYRNNIDTTLSLLECMQMHDLRRIIFSSSATVYAGKESPYNENMKRGECLNPYGQTKVFSEKIIEDCANADRMFSSVILRYFNPVGAHESGLIGEMPQGIPNNIMPFISQVAAGLLDRLTVFGNDYPTSDGTCMRDFIHVVDLAKAHVSATSFILHHTGVEVFNIGSGRAYSVKELIRAFERVNGVNIPFVYGERRQGDIPCCYADVAKAEKMLGWRAEKTLEEMCADSWKWQKNIM